MPIILSLDQELGPIIGPIVFSYMGSSKLMIKKQKTILASFKVTKQNFLCIPVFLFFPHAFKFLLAFLLIKLFD